jgi:outer membrane protein assembly factor BamB
MKIVQTFRQTLLLGFFFAAPVLIGADLAADWPRFRGSTADGVSPEKGINKDWNTKPPKELWRLDMGNKGFSGPSVVDGKVFIVDRKGSQDVVRGINLADGKDAWQFPYEESIGDNFGFARATPTYDAGKLYTLSASGRIHCLNAADGKPVWNTHLQQQLSGKLPQWHYSMSVFIDGDLAIVCPGGPNGSVVALNKADGKKVWSGGTDIAGYATPTVATVQNSKQYVIFGGTSAFGVDAKSGQQLWQVPWKTQYDVNAATPIVLGNSVFITSDYGRGCCMIDVAAGGAKIRWENKEVQSHFNTPIFFQGNLYATSDPNKLVCLDPQTGNARWTQKGFGKGGLIGVDGTLIGIDGVTGAAIMAALDPTAYRELGRIAVLRGGDKQYWTAPVVAAGRLILRDKSALVCLDLK